MSATALTDQSVATLAYESQQAISIRMEVMRHKRGLSIRALADELSMNYSSLSHRLQNRVDWTVTDVLAIRRRFGEDVLEGM